MRRAFLFFLLLVTGLSGFSMFEKVGAYGAEDEEIPIMCHSFFGASQVSEKFAPPVNFFSPLKTTLITATCMERKSVVLEVGTGEKSQYILKTGYKKVGKNWEKISFSGKETVGKWLVGKASYTLPGLKDGEKGEVLAYVCQKVDGVWKCGCSDSVCKESKWLSQKFELSEDTLQEARDAQEEMTLLRSRTSTVFDIHYSSKPAGLVGEKITLTGSNFAVDTLNEVLWNGKVEQRVTSKSGSYLTINIPDLPPAKYEVTVRKKGEVTEHSTFIWILAPQTKVPKISSISPQTGKQGGTFTIYGEGFTQNNDVITTYGILEALPSEDGKSITFTYDVIEGKMEFWEKPGVPFHFKQPVYVAVANTGGVSNSKTFYLDI